MALEFDISFAGVPFIPDKSVAYRMPGRTGAVAFTNTDREPPHKHQVDVDLIDEINRRADMRYLVDFALPPGYLGRNLGAIASPPTVGPNPSASLPIGAFYYPTGASRWSVFRGLATSSMAKAMLQACQPISLSLPMEPQTFTMKVNPIAPYHDNNDVASYTVETSMYMLPPRPLADHGGNFDGLYLITLVDERYYFQGTPASGRPRETETWDELLNFLFDSLGVASYSYSAIANAYVRPEIDSQFWSNYENAATLLDAAAANIGRSVVRKMDGSYTVETPIESQAIVAANRGNATRVARIAGGDIFNSGTRLNVGNLNASKNAVVPSAYYVTFPKYVMGDDPVPHFLNPRTGNQRPSAWYEESFGDTYPVYVPITSGGSLVSGLVGTSTQFIHSTAKALFSGETSGLPLNYSGLVSLANQIVVERYNAQVAAAVDDTYPGT